MPTLKAELRFHVRGREYELLRLSQSAEYEISAAFSKRVENQASYSRVNRRKWRESNFILHVRADFNFGEIFIRE